MKPISYHFNKKSILDLQTVQTRGFEPALRCIQHQYLLISMNAAHPISPLVLLLVFSIYSNAQSIVRNEKSSGSFPVVTSTSSAKIIYDAGDDLLVQKVAQLFQGDVEKVTGKKLHIDTTVKAAVTAILIGNIQHSRLLQHLISQKKLDVSQIKNKWEAYQVMIIKSPFAGVAQALVIAGSDRRGTAYGVLELSKQMGVSPWNWWADVPVAKKNEIYIKAASVLRDAPKIQYRGIFINDEAPALSGWSREKFGGFNHLFYEKVFELILRLKGNYLWPAMWGNAFYDDDSLNRETANTYGIVIGTSHHEPLMRAHDEWRRHGSGKWDYTTNAEKLKAFWKAGMQRATNEKIVSVGMRGDGDEPMSRETATALLETIVTDQRKIIEEVTGKPASETPQLWALYKEVQDYYDKGMRVPDDVTLLVSDDNWGNIRRLPKLNEPKRKGGYGIYYHFDYVGGPRNYKWLNTNNIARVWEQMHLAYRYGADKIWIVNVGDIKPMELPISFFLDYAWNPEKWNEDNLTNYYRQWSAEQFGENYADEISDILVRYGQYSAMRKPELLDANTYQLLNYNEAARIQKQWTDLQALAENVNSKLDPAAQDAYFQLVLHPILALTNLHQLYNAVAINHWYASQQSLTANEWADKAKAHYLADSLLTIRYNKQLAGGKWNHMMDQPHIGYTYWQQPPTNVMPVVKYVHPDSAKPATVAMALESMKILNAVSPEEKGNNFIEKEGVVSTLAGNYAKVVNTPSVKWKTIPHIGREGSGLTTFPVTAATKPVFSNNSPRVEYTIWVIDTGIVKLLAYFSPTLNLFNEEEGLQYALSINDEKPQLLSLNKEDKNSISGIWNSWVANNVIVKTSEHKLSKPGLHIVKYWAVSPAVILQKLVVDCGGLKPSYLGPPETRTVRLQEP